MAGIIETNADIIGAWPSSTAVLLPGGHPPKEGDLFKQVDLGQTLQFLVDEENLRNARLNLVLATRLVLSKGLGLLGVSAPEEM